MSQCGIYDVPAKRISAGFSKAWAQYQNASPVILRRAFTTELAQRANDRDGLAGLRAVSEAAGNEVTFYKLISRQHVLVNAWCKQWRAGV